MLLRFAVPVALLVFLACGSNGDPPNTGSAMPRQTRSPAPSPATPTESPAPAAEQTPPPPAMLVVINGTVIDGARAEPIGNGYVTVAEGRITGVGPGQPPIPAGATVIDARGGTIMPGMIDTHVHVARGVFSGGAGTLDPGGLMPWLAAGMTTLRDVATPPGAFPAVKQAADGQTAAHQAPRVVWAGPMVTAVGGYPFTVPRYASVGEDVTSADEARQVVGRLGEGGAGVIKLGLEKGYYGDDGWPLLSLEIVQAITHTAHSRGMRVTAHVTSVDEVRLALDGGVDDLAHAPLEPVPEEILREMLQNGPGMATTATVWGRPAASAEAAANAKRYADMGGIVSIGTDYGCCGQAVGLSPYLYEMQYLLAAGLTPMQVLMAATRGGAVLAGVYTEVGTIEPGKIADIVVLDGDPLADISAVANVRAVIQAGFVVAGG